MKTLLAYINMLRPVNAAMAGAATILGAWLSRGPMDFRAAALLAIAAVCAVGYGNVVNDIKDVATDRLSHPNRPLPRKQVSVEGAVIFAFFLFCFSIVNAWMVSTAHGLGTVAPLALLSAYAFFFKATPFAGNVLVSALVAYPLVFGGLTAPLMNRLLIPACLAFLLNMVREIVKDIQDEQGDCRVGIVTTAKIHKGTLKAIVLSLSLLYALLVFVPFVLKQFGAVYALVCAALALPLHAWWTVMVARQSWAGLPNAKLSTDAYASPASPPFADKVPCLSPAKQGELGMSAEGGLAGDVCASFPDKRLGSISLLIKIEMLAGLIALAADQAIR